MDASIRREFAARLRAMRGYANVRQSDVAAKFPGREGTETKNRVRTIQAWENGESPSKPTDDEAGELAVWLAELSRKQGAGVPSSFLWPPPFPPICQPSAVVDEATRQQLASAIRAIEAAQDTLRHEGAGEQSQSDAQ